jgi:hypothetical protein
MNLASRSSCLRKASVLNHAFSLVWRSQMRSHEVVTTQVLSNLASLLRLLSSRLESVDISDSWPCAKVNVLVGSRCACTCTSLC